MDGLVCKTVELVVECICIFLMVLGDNTRCTHSVDIPVGTVADTVENRFVREDEAGKVHKN